MTGEGGILRKREKTKTDQREYKFSGRWGGEEGMCHCALGNYHDQPKDEINKRDGTRGRNG